jgi:phenylacetate-CoA ligase
MNQPLREAIHMRHPLSEISKHILYPLYYIKNGDRRLKRLREIEEHQWLPQESLKTLQFNRLKNIIAYAYENVRYYRRKFDSLNLSPESIRTADDIKNIPILTKQDIQNNLEELISQRYEKKNLIQDASGGSTGKPTVFYKDLERYRLRRADQIRHDRWTGWDIGDPYALIWGAQRDISSTQTFRQYIVSNFIERCRTLDAFELNEETLHGFAEELNTYQPKMILGYANGLYEFAKYLNTATKEYNISPRGIISSAETLSAEKRLLIESTFSCKVLNRYGSREVGLVASECLHQEGLHINADNVYVEVVGSDSMPIDTDMSGDLIVTDLWNYGMPLIRYRMEDRGSLSAKLCSCGRSLPLLKTVEGRTSDFLVSKDGTLVHGEYFTHLFYGMEEVLRFQLVQETMDHVVLKLVLRRELPHEKELEIINDISKVLGNDVKVKICIVSDIPPTASGKFLFTISKLQAHK